MADPVTPVVPAGGGGLTMTAVAPAPHPDTFHEVLSELNPLQYVPVIGTIYRAATGDTIPETVRELGALAFSGLLGGPIGLATNIAGLVIEKATGIDPEAIGQHLLHEIGIGADTPATAPAATGTQATASTTTANATTASATTATATTASATMGATTGATPAAPPGHMAAPAQAAAQPPVHRVAWSPTQLTAYGVTRTPTGDLKRGNVTGADVLNDLELARHADGASSGRS